jgi:peptide chain release factor subunit 1
MSRRPRQLTEDAGPIRHSNLDTETFERLGGLRTDDAPVLSVYLDLDPARFATPAARAAELAALVQEARREAKGPEGSLEDGLTAAIARVSRLLDSDPAIARGARSLAIFAVAGVDAVEVVTVPTMIEPLAVIDTVPWLEPLAGTLVPDAWGVAVVGRRTARLFRGGPAALVQFAALTDEVHRRHAQGGWSQARFQRGIDEEVSAHVRRAARELSRAHRRRPFGHLAIVASSELWPMVQAALPGDLRPRVAGVVDADVHDASAADVLRAVAPLLTRAERERERRLLVRLEEALGTGGAAVAGLDEVLATLEQEAVDVLLVVEGLELVGGRCPRCGRLSASPTATCQDDGSPLIAVDAVEHAVELAIRRAAEIVVVRHETAALRGRGGIAALLRW